MIIGVFITVYFISVLIIALLSYVIYLIYSKFFSKETDNNVFNKKKEKPLEYIGKKQNIKVVEKEKKEDFGLLSKKRIVKTQTDIPIIPLKEETVSYNKPSDVETSLPVEPLVQKEPSVLNIFEEKHKDELLVLQLENDKLKYELQQLQKQVDEQAKLVSNGLWNRTDADNSTKKNSVNSDEKPESFYLSKVSHKLRTPLNSIIGMSNLLSESDLTAEQKKFLDIIVDSSQNLVSTIDNIVYFSMTESGFIKVEKNEFRLKHILETIIQLFHKKAKEKGIEITFYIDSKIPEKLIGDYVKIEQILINLIDNAVKATNKGYIKISINYKEENKDYLTLKFAVSDTGTGIPDNLRSTLFHPLYEGQNTATNKFELTGIGLAISRNLVVLMGGDINYKSEMNIGTEVWFTVNVNKIFEDIKNEKNFAKEQSEINSKTVISDINPDTLSPKIIIFNNDNKAGTSVKSDKKRGLNVLLAEDNEINSKVIELSLIKLGHKVDMAKNGFIALEKFKQHHYEMVIMDIQMPEIDGIEATKLIRKFEKENNISERAMIIAITANTMKEVIDNCIASGIDSFISKPFKANELKEVIANLVKAKELNYIH